MLQVNRLERDIVAMREENNRLATLAAERQPVTDRLNETISNLQQVLAVFFQTDRQAAGTLMNSMQLMKLKMVV